MSVCGLCGDNFCGMIVCSKLTRCVMCFASYPSTLLRGLQRIQEFKWKTACSVPVASYPSTRLRGLQRIQEFKVTTACSVPENENIVYSISCTLPAHRRYYTHAFRHVDSIHKRTLYCQREDLFS